MGRLAHAFLVAAFAASTALAADNSPPGLSLLQVTDCNGTAKSILTTNINNPNILLRVQDQQAGLHVGNAPLIPGINGSSISANTAIYWDFDNGGASATDASQTGNHGIFQDSTGGNCPGQDPCFETSGGPTGAYGSNLHFIASRPSTNVLVHGLHRPASSTLAGIFSALTVESWVKLDFSTGPRPFVEYSTTTRPAGTTNFLGPAIRFGTADGTTNTDGAIWVNFVSSGGTTGITDHVLATAGGVLDTNWHLVTVSYSASTGMGAIYVDGVERAKSALGSFSLRTDGEFRVGYSTATALTMSLQGRLDQFRVLSRAVSENEAQQVFDGGRVRLKRGLAAATTIQVSVSGAWANGETGQVNFNTNVSALGGNLTAGGNLVEFIVGDRAGNVAALSGVITVQASAPGAPILTAIGPQGSGNITYSWTRPLNICTSTSPSYRIYTCADTLVGIPDITDAGNPPAPTIEGIPGLNVNVKLGRKISAIDQVLILESAKSNCGETYTNADPPTGLTGVNVTTGSMTLNWSRGANPLYTRFELRQFPDAARLGQPTSLIGLQENFTGTTYNLTGLSPGTSYYFSVFSFNGDGADITTPAGIANPTPANADVATTVGGSTLTARALSDTLIQWDWRATPGADFYRVFNATNPATVLCQNTKAAFCAGPPPESCLCASGGYTADTQVSATLVASGPPPAPPGAQSAAASAFTLALQPSAFATTAVTSNTVSLSWSANGNNPNTNYEIRRATSASIFGAISTTSAQGTSAVIVGLFPASTYFFQLRARNGDEVFSAPALMTPQAVTLPAPGITSSSGPPTTYEAPAGAIALWHFDESTGTIVRDSSGNRHDGVLTCDFAGCSSTPTYVNGPAGLGSALRLIGQGNSYVHVSTSAAFDNPPALTVEAWVNPSTTFQTPEATVIAKGSSTDFGFSLDVDNSFGLQRWRFRVGNNSGGGNVCGGAVECLVSPAVLDPGKWHQLIAVWNPGGGGSQQMYVDGVFVASRALTAVTFRDATKRVTLGNRPFGGTGTYNTPFAGFIDELRVLNRALTAAEAAQEYSGGLSGTFAAPPPNEDIQLSIPPNAFGGPVRVFVSNNPQTNPIKTAPAAIATGLSLPPTGFTLVPGSLIEIVAQVNGVAFTETLGSSVTVTLPYTDDDGNGLVDGTSPPLDATRLVLFTLEETPPRWVALPTTVDPATRRVSGLTPHFSLFALFGTTGVGSGDDVSVFPVPWKPGSGGSFDSVANCNGGRGLCFDKLAQQGTIRLYAISGELLIELPFAAVNAGKLAWDGRNAGGRQVASGVYFARINGFSSGTRIIKFAIER